MNFAFLISVVVLSALTCCTPSDRSVETVREDRRMEGTRKDDSAALQAAIDEGSRTGQPVHLEPGLYVAGDLVLRTGTTLVGGEGLGGQVTIVQSAGSRYLMGINPGLGGSPDPADNIRDVTLRGLTLIGRVEEDGFAEHAHLMTASAVTGLTIDRVVFRSWRGDGLYLGSSNESGVERHNRSVRVVNSLFDGGNANNRNAISIIDAMDAVISNNVFRNTTRPDMPGAVDVEPDNHTFHIIKHIVISNNYFEDIGGSAGVVQIHLAHPDSWDIKPSHIYIRSNVIVNSDTAIQLILGKMLSEELVVCDDNMMINVKVYHNIIRSDA